MIGYTDPSSRVTYREKGAVGMSANLVLVLRLTQVLQRSHLSELERKRYQSALVHLFEQMPVEYPIQ